LFVSLITTADFNGSKGFRILFPRVDYSLLIMPTLGAGIPPGFNAPGLVTHFLIPASVFHSIVRCVAITSSFRNSVRPLSPIS